VTTTIGRPSELASPAGKKRHLTAPSGAVFHSVRRALCSHPTLITGDTSEQPTRHLSQRVYLIAVTPFTGSGALDLASTDRMVDFCLEKGVAGLTMLGIMVTFSALP
jgi:hypothetical protein